MRSKSAKDVCTSIPTESSCPIGKNSRVWSVVNATSVPIVIAPEPVAKDCPASQ